MRPFREALHGYPRMVRDMAKSLGKTVRLEIEGGSTHVDRDILQRLEAPLTHMLRNAVDHGIETPEARAAAGKPPEGRIVLEARHASGVLLITVSDDGAGIDLEQLRRRVVELGHTTEAIAANLSDAELLDFLFLPGFTTKREITEVSGRGVGLDIVQTMARTSGSSTPARRCCCRPTRARAARSTSSSSATVWIATGSWSSAFGENAIWP
jgi:two-component system sensor histidine kinase and response regulator WspE